MRHISREMKKVYILTKMEHGDSEPVAVFEAGDDAERVRAELRADSNDYYVVEEVPVCTSLSDLSPRYWWCSFLKFEVHAGTFVLKYQDTKKQVSLHGASLYWENWDQMRAQWFLPYRVDIQIHGPTKEQVLIDAARIVAAVSQSIPATEEALNKALKPFFVTKGVEPLNKRKKT